MTKEELRSLPPPPPICGHRGFLPFFVGVQVCSTPRSSVIVVRSPGLVRPRAPPTVARPQAVCPPPPPSPPAPCVPPVFSVFLCALLCSLPVPAFCRGLPFSFFSALRVYGCDFCPAEGAWPRRVPSVRAAVALVFLIYRVFAFPSPSLIAKSCSGALGSREFSLGVHFSAVELST